jgi:hypothetical protein
VRLLRVPLSHEARMRGHTKAVSAL